LVCVACSLFFGEANGFLAAVGAIAVPALDCGASFEAARVGGSQFAGAAISNPNRAATSVSSSIFAVLGAAFVSQILSGAGDQLVFIHAAKHE
jgi:hypothetical protein